MALTEANVEDKIEVVGEHKHVQIRTARVIYDDGTEISRSFSRHVLQCSTKSGDTWSNTCLLYTSPSPRDRQKSRMPSSA